ncbi:hypothetical protein Z945_3327 [Sulfitobacter noctilucae]|uniref:SOS response-associated peptidase n=1 Tax=Sulfitobacter noctilucae TaxID=1342302 RepID=UPI000468E691|nr:SOS response-associated peptidase [Sulfitobacter noctilucae]KIN70863.1 hypothetical protein Z945_3327 [Sulfitobacter noctilucae]
MCGRMAVTLPPDAMAQIFTASPANDLPQVPNYNVCPTNQVHIVTAIAEEGSEAPQRKLGSMRWGLVPKWYKTVSDGPLLINARAETLAEKPAFRDAARQRRGLIVASGFYEWTKDAEGGRDPWFITRRDGAPLALAAVWQNWTSPEGEGMATCAAITTKANAPMHAIHHRMPLIINEQDWPLWLGERGKGAARLMTPGADDLLQWHRVDRAVNSNRASGPALIEPLASGPSAPPSVGPD